MKSSSTWDLNIGCTEVSYRGISGSGSRNGFPLRSFTAAGLPVGYCGVLNEGFESKSIEVSVTGFSSCYDITCIYLFCAVNFHCCTACNFFNMVTQI